jgi:mycofactocin system glycosyltransferase
MVKRYVVDASWRHLPKERVVIAGSPLKVFRITNAGEKIIDALEGGAQLPDGHEPLTSRLEAAGAIHPVCDGLIDDGDIEVVIPAYITDETQAQHIQLLVDVLQPLRITVVDDGSPLPVACTGATVIRHDTNRGPAGARNTGAALVKAKYIAFIDADCVVSSEDVRAVATHFESPRVGLVAPRVAAIEDDSVISQYESVASPLDMGNQPAQVQPMSRVSYVPSAVLVVRTETFVELGGFDTAHRYGEDVDFVWRAIDNGWQCRYDPYIVCLHRNRNSWYELTNQRMSYGEAAATLYIAHPTRLAPLRADATTAASVLTTVIGTPLSALSTSAISASLLWRELHRAGIPAKNIVRIAADRWMHTAYMTTQAITRVWWPIILIIALFSRRARRLLAFAVLFPLLYELRTSNTKIVPWKILPLVATMRVVDHGAYSVGVWKGMWRNRTVGPLLPKISVRRSPSN